MSQAVEDNGLVFDPKFLRVERIKEQQEYEGLRVNLVARLERARIHMQVDIGFGDVIVPPPKEIQYPALLNFFRRRHDRSEEHTSELQSRQYLVCRLLLEKKKEDHEKEPVSQKFVRPEVC